METEAEAVGRSVLEAVAGAVNGTDWAPPEGAVLAECVVIMGWFYVDGTYGSSHLVTGAPWSGRGLVEQTIQRMEAIYDDEIPRGEEP